MAGFGDETSSSSTQKLPDPVGPGGPGKHDDGQLWVIFAKDRECSQTIHVRQVVIEHDKVQIRMGFSKCESLRAVTRLNHGNALIESFQDLTKPFANESMVIND